MKLRSVLGLACLVALMFGCGRVIVEGDGQSGGGGSGGEQGQGGALACETIECSQTNPSFCSCETHCTGSDLRADCEVHDDGVVCECHLGSAYLGLCWTTSSPVCGLPDGCCYAYLPS